MNRRPQSCGLLRATAFHRQPLQSLEAQLRALGRLTPLQLVPVAQTRRLQRNTLLRSPHVHKTARDQVEVQRLSQLYRIRSSSYGWLRLLRRLSLRNPLPLALDQRHRHRQRLLLFPPTHDLHR